jgi:SAM-dependent methyltransferase
LLEVGASYGHWLAAARRRGWDVAGVELDARAAAFARDENGVPVRTGDLLSGLAPDAGPFDALVAWHVLEHTRDPAAELDRAFALLRPGGVLGLRVPNGASFGARVAGVWWPWAAPPDHLWYFTPSSLRAFAEQRGFEVLEARTARGDGYDPFLNLALGIAGRAIDVKRRLSRSGEAAPAGRGTGGGAAGAVFERARRVTERLASLTRVERLLERRGLGDELVLYARKPR